MKKKLIDFAKGLFLSGPVDKIPEGLTRRNRGLSSTSLRSFKSRSGSTQIHALNAHSLVYFSSAWHSGVSTSFYKETTSKKTGLSGERLSFVAMPPTAGRNDYLFVAGGGTLFKIDEDGTVSNWGIAKPGTTVELADSGTPGDLSAGVYKYQITFLNSETGTRSQPNEIFEISFSPSDAAQTAEIVNGTRLLLKFENNVVDTTGFHTPVNNGSATFHGSIKKYGSYAIDLNGTSQSVSIPDCDDLPPKDKDFTIHGWFYPDDVSGNQTLFNYRGDDDNYFNVSLSNATLALGVVDGGSSIVSAVHTTSVAATTWQHFAVVRHADTWLLALDGVFIGGVRRSYSLPSYNTGGLDGVLYLGAIGGSVSFFNGKMDEFTWVVGEALWTENFDGYTAESQGDNALSNGSGNIVNITNIPQSPDSQVDTIELWRTVADGSYYFRLAALPHGETSFADGIADLSLDAIELPYDNIKPYSWFDDCFGPYNGSMFWITRTQEGEKGRVYYSPIGRVESMQGFINVTSDDEGLQRLFGYAGNLYVISKSRVFQIYGSNPYYSQEIAGTDGTTKPFSVVVTAKGPVWEASEGWRIFAGGSQSWLLANEAIRPITRGEAVGNLTSFDGVVATFARNEYIISSSTQTLAIDLDSKRWRDLGVGLSALSYSPSADQVAATLSSAIVDFEKEGDTQDNGSNISIDLEPPHLDFEEAVFIERVRIDANSATETIACTGYHDGSSIALGNLSTTTGRRHTEFSVERGMNRFGLRLTGSLDSQVEIFQAEIDYTPLTLTLDFGTGKVSLPGRFGENRQTLTFEMSEEQGNFEYVFERLYSDINTGSANVTATLHLIQNASISLATLSNASREVVVTEFCRVGRFDKLVLAGDFTGAIKLRKLELKAYPLLLLLTTQDKQFQIPGTFDNDKNLLSFPLFNEDPTLLNREYIFERLFVDVDTASQTITATLDIMQNAALALGTFSNSSREMIEKQLYRIGKFVELNLSGTFTAAVGLRRLELIAAPLVLFVRVNDKIVQIPGTMADDRTSLTFEVFRNEEDDLTNTYIFERLFYDLNTSDVTLTLTLNLFDNSSIALGTIDNTSRTADEISIHKTGRFKSLVISGTFTSAIYLYRLELIAYKNERQRG